MLAENSNHDDKIKIIKSSYSLAFIVSVLVTMVYLPLYQIIIKYLVSDNIVRELSLVAVYWMTLGIPIRMLVFVASMCLFSTNHGKSVSYIYLVTIISNLSLDWFFCVSYELRICWSIYFFRFCILSRAVLDVISIHKICKWKPFRTPKATRAYKFWK
ncbi:MATE family efflux transporter [Acidithiobacillus ferrianus]|uniref:MATE family efflux transporter n=1 Tax=Acidithiobacillus ferrianus TaxID=2678518 RepID=UPI0034E5D4B0